MAVAIPIMMVAGAAISAAGAISQAQAQQRAAEYNAKLNERNATIATQQSTAAVDQQRREAEQVFGSMRAGIGASGVTQEGSPMDVLASSITQAKLDEHNILYRGELKRMGYEESANLDRMSGRTAKEQGYWNAASNMLTGVGRAGYSYTAANSDRGGTTSQVLNDAREAQRKQQVGG